MTKGRCFVILTAKTISHGRKKGARLSELFGRVEALSILFSEQKRGLKIGEKGEDDKYLIW